MSQTRKIDGKKFTLMSAHAKKSDADYYAQTFRRSSKYVRVIPFALGYQVWAYGSISRRY